MSTLEQSYLKTLMLALGLRKDLRIWRQNVGTVEVVKRGKIVGIFDAGPPPGAADISGIVGPEGWRLEIETKASKTISRETQEAWEKMILKHGGVYVRVRYNENQTMEENISRTIKEIEEGIGRRRRCK